MPVDPSKLRIDLYPTEILRAEAEPIDLTDEVRGVALRMIELMRAANGIGLAGPQVGLGWQIFVCHVPPDEDRPLGADPELACAEPEVFINPEVVSRAGVPEGYEEGCLSLPGISGEVFRPPVVTMRATDLEGNRRERTAGGLLGRCWQHEYDHLVGTLIIDKMDEAWLARNRTQIRNLEKRAR